MNIQNQTFFFSLFFSRLGDQILLFLVPLVIYQQTQSVALSGAAFFFETLPRFVAFPICGILSDRFSNHSLIRISQFYRAITCFLGIALFFAFGGIGWLIVISIICGVLTTQGLMAREVMLPQLFPQYKFEKTASYTQIADQIGAVLGPIFAAILLIYMSWEKVVFVSGILFLLSNWTFKYWSAYAKPSLTTPERQFQIWYAPLLTAIAYIRDTPALQVQIALALADNLVLGVTLATSAIMITGVHMETQNFYALVQTAGAITTIVILYTIAHTSLPLNAMGG